LPIGTSNGTDKPEQRDLSQFCTSELHASRAGSYEYARRVLVGHTATVKLRTGSQTGRIKEGDVVQVYLRVEADGDAPWFYNYYYQVESVGLDFTGEETLSLTHFPVDADGRSLLADAVVRAPVTGVILPSQRTGPSGDVAGRDTDTSVPGSLTSGTPLSPPDQPGLPPFTPPEQPPEPPAPPAPGDPVIPGRPVPPPAEPQEPGEPYQQKRWVISGYTYSGFNAWGFAYAYASSEPEVTGARKLYGSPVPANVTNNPDVVSLNFQLEVANTTIDSTGHITINGNGGIDLLNGRFTQYNSPIYGGGLLWDGDYSYTIQEVALGG
jgi:hypothetical protein